MKKMVIMVSVLVLLSIGLSGCIDGYTHEVTITWSDTDMSFSHGSDLSLKIHGQSNVVRVGESVSLSKIDFSMGSVNNTVHIMGSSLVNHTSSYDLHDCPVFGSGSNGNRIVLGGDK